MPAGSEAFKVTVTGVDSVRPSISATPSICIFVLSGPWVSGRGVPGMAATVFCSPSERLTVVTAK